MRRLVLYSVTVIGGIVLSACSTPTAKSRVELYWPLPPDPPKIAYEQSVTSIKDLEPPPSFFKKVGRFLFGEEEVPVLVRPFALCVKGEKLYVADTGLQAVHVFDFGTKKYLQIFKLKEPYRLLTPVGVTVDPEGNVFVSDSKWNRVFVFDPEGTFLHEFVKDGEVERVGGIVYHPLNRRIYVVDTAGHRVAVYSREGEKLRSFGKRGHSEGAFNFPTHLTVSPDGDLYVTDSLNFRVQRFDPEGAFQSAFGSLGRTLGSFSKPKGVAVDSMGHVYVVDGIYDTVQLFNGNGDLLMNFGKSGIDPGHFWLPAGIAIDSQNRIYVADTYNFRVQIFKFLGAPEEPNGMDNIQ